MPMSRAPEIVRFFTALPQFARAPFHHHLFCDAPLNAASSRSKKKRQKRQKQQVLDRTEALRLLKEGRIIRDVSRITGVGRTTVNKIKQANATNQQSELTYLLGESIRPGRPLTITEEECFLINERVIVAAEREFAVDLNTLKHVLSRIAPDGRKGNATGIPSNAALRTYRELNRAIAYKRIENREQAKLAAQSYSHVETFFSVLEKIAEKHSGILSNPNRIWNMDETSVDNIEGKHMKVFSSSATKNGGAKAVKSSYGISKHITAVIAASAAGRIAPPFFTIAAKRKSSEWFAPVTGVFREQPRGIIARFTKEHWFPLDGVIKVSDNGSMEGALMPSFVKHVDSTAQRYLEEKEVYLLFLDGHSSRKDMEWVEYCVSHFIEAAANAANTSHFLQPCDQRINKTFQEHMRFIRDEFCRQGRVDVTKVNFNLACAVYAYECVTASDVKESFKKTGTFPFDRRFPERFKTSKDETAALIKKEEDTLAQSGGGSAVPSVRKRQSDKETFSKLTDIFEGNGGISTKIKLLGTALQEAETVNRILMEHISRPGSGNASVTIENLQPRVLYDAGQPAEWITHVEDIKRRRLEKERALLEEQEKERRQAEKSQKHIEAREQAVKTAAENRQKRQAEQILREEMRKRKRIEMARRKLARQSAVELRRAEVERK